MEFERMKEDRGRSIICKAGIDITEYYGMTLVE